MISYKDIILFTKDIKILFIEDDESTRIASLILLENFFDSIDSAINGKDGLEKYLNYYKDKKLYYDLIITDINMPIMDGKEMIEKIREINYNQPIIVISAYSERDDLINLIQLSITNFIMKPIKLKPLIQTLYMTCKNIYLEKEEEHHYKYIQSIIDSIQDSIMIIREDYSVELMNKQIRDRLDPKYISDPLSPKCYEISHYRDTPCDGDDHPCPLKLVMDTHKNATVIHNHKKCLNKQYFVELSATPLWDDKNNCIGIIESSRDITDHINIRNRLLKEKKILDYKVSHDLLTNLPNRMFFDNKLIEGIKQAEQNKNILAIFFIDLDYFKEINDSFGHDIGDEVLQYFSNLLVDTFRKDDTISRFGGDEFAIIIENIDEISTILKIAQKVIDILIDPVDIKGNLLKLSCSIGISLYPNDSSDITTLLKYADSAMYKAKDSGRDNFKFYSNIGNKNA